jgi:uncharacterized membrane protein YfcA
MTEFGLLAALLGVFVFFAAGFTQGLTGFGFALVAVPILGLVASPQLVVPAVIISGTASNFIVLFHLRRWVNIRRIWPLTLAGAVAAPFGVYLLDILSADVLRIIIGVAVLVFTATSIRGLRRSIRHEKLAMVPVGLASGLLGGSIGTSGPPVILFLANQGMEKQAFRANLIGYFTVLSVVTVAALSVEGVITTSTIQFVLISVPGMAIGALTGVALAGRVKEKLFRRIALSIVAAAGVLSIASGLDIL